MHTTRFWYNSQTQKNKKEENHLDTHKVPIVKRFGHIQMFAFSTIHLFIMSMSVGITIHQFMIVSEGITEPNMFMTVGNDLGRSTGKWTHIVIPITKYYSVGIIPKSNSKMVRTDAKSMQWIIN